MSFSVIYYKRAAFAVNIRTVQGFRVDLSWRFGCIWATKLSGKFRPVAHNVSYSRNSCKHKLFVETNFGIISYMPDLRCGSHVCSISNTYPAILPMKYVGWHIFWIVCVYRKAPKCDSTAKLRWYDLCGEMTIIHLIWSRNYVGMTFETEVCHHCIGETCDVINYNIVTCHMCLRWFICRLFSTTSRRIRYDSCVVARVPTNRIKNIQIRYEWEVAIIPIIACIESFKPSLLRK